MNLRLWFLRLLAHPSHPTTQGETYRLEQEDAEAKREELRRRLLRAETEIIRQAHEDPS